MQRFVFPYTPPDVVRKIEVHLNGIPYLDTVRPLCR